MTDILQHLAKTYEKSPSRERAQKNQDKSKQNSDRKFGATRKSEDSSSSFFFRQTNPQEFELSPTSPPQKMIRNMNDNNKVLQVHRSIAQNLFRDFKIAQRRDSLIHTQQERSISTNKYNERQANANELRESVSSFKNILKNSQTKKDSKQDVTQNHEADEVNSSIIVIDPVESNRSIKISGNLMKSSSQNRFSCSSVLNLRKKESKTNQNSLNNSMVKQQSSQSKSSVQQYSKSNNGKVNVNFNSKPSALNSKQVQNRVQHQVKVVRQIDSSQMAANRSLSQIRSRGSLTDEKNGLQSTQILNEMRNSPLYKYQKRIATMYNSPSRNQSESTNNSLIRLNQTNISLNNTQKDKRDKLSSSQLNQDLKIVEQCFSNGNQDSLKKRQPILNKKDVQKQEQRLNKLQLISKAEQKPKNFETIQEKNEEEKMIQIDNEQYNTEGKQNKISEDTPKHQNQTANVSWIKTQLDKEKERLSKNISQIQQIKPVKTSK
ncbi:UNKNOWN [Stylonychia lemnae]|uniref:Uncharacterized protein n=1 Tax=Stylonychia lemnae TaxID=5949 RepID=A0A078B411_STYLE|nr:UNKNOWN [Stylonychia lemnae]|eukprot:CDW88976.1 UNKNOWN [Stylonychia lemnae]